MDIGTRMKEAFNSPESTVASHGEVDHHTPGAYPVDADTPVHESGPDAANSAMFDSKSKHNKLHKREDPRGWVGDSKAGLSHKHTDSGVGLTEEHDTSPTRQPGAIPGLETEGAYTYTAPGIAGANAPPLATYGREDPTQSPWAESETDTKADPYRSAGALSGIVPLLDTRGDTEVKDRHADHVTTESQAGTTTAGVAGTSADREDAKQTRQPADVVQEHPYWGDLPRGAGVYNTVTGHGSEEDQEKRQHELYEQETQDLSGQHPSTVAALDDSTRARDDLHQDITDRSVESQKERSGLDEKEDARKKEALVGTGGATAATAAAATAYKMHERDNKPGEDESQQEKHTSGEKKERRRSFGLFHRSKEDDHAKDKAKEEKITHADESKAEKKHRLGGLFHRSSGDSDNTVRYSRREDVDKKRDESNTGAYAMAGAGLGAGGAAAYMATRDCKDDNDQIQDRSALGQQHQPEHRQTLSSRAEPQREHRDPMEHTTQTYDERESKHSHDTAGAAAATAGAAGLGAGALAYRQRDDKQIEPREQLIKSRHPNVPRADSETLGANTSSAARAGPGDNFRDTTHTHTGNNLAGSANPLVGSSSTSATNTAKQPPPPVADHANHGDYNLLSSGTPSGIKLDDDDETSSKGNVYQPQPTIPETREVDQHSSRSKTTAAAGLGAASLGAAAGAAAYQSRDRDDEGPMTTGKEETELEKLKRAEDKQAKQYEREDSWVKPDARSFPLVPGAGSSKTQKVTHRCQKCGEENDISSYFAKERQ